MLFSRRDFTRIVLPLIVEQLLAVTIGMVDTMMVSSAGEAAISGVSLVDMVNQLLVLVFSALASGGAVVISQYLGKEDLKKAEDSSKQLILSVVVISLVITLLSVLFRSPLLRLIFGRIEPSVMHNAQVYFLFTALSYPFLGLYNCGAAIFRSMGNSKVSMVASLIMNLVNVGGNALLIFVFHLGAAGAAIATLFSRVVGSALMMLLLRNKNNAICIEKLFKTKPDLAIIGSICRIGIPSGMEGGMFQFGRLLTQSLISTFGTVQIAANAVATSVTAIECIPGTAMGLAAITIVGRCVGAEKKDQAKYYARKLLLLSVLSIFAVSAVICLFSSSIVKIYNLSNESAILAKQIIFCYSAFVAVWPLAFMLPNVFRAASDVKMPVMFSSLSMWVFRVGLSYVFAYAFEFGVMSVWFAMFCDWFFRAAVFLPRFLRGTWLTKYRSI